MFPKIPSSTLQLYWDICQDKDNILFPREVIEAFKVGDEINAAKDIVEDDKPKQGM